MASRRSTRPPKRTGRLSRSSAPSSPWPRIEELIECGGTISIGEIDPIPCAAVASDESNMLAALVRGKEETFMELLARLDAAVARAIDEEDFTDEINRK